MGSGSWSPSTYNDRVTARVSSGKDVFDYSDTAKKTGDLRPHQTLDPRGLKMREAFDSPEHPNSNAIVIGLDVTGSMGKVVRGIHADLPRLHELLLGHRYIADPQIMFTAVGDATCDNVPLQVGQFESDNRMDQNLENMVLEGGGGGQKTESYELTLYVAARHTSLDCLKKRGRKGYLFMIGDEMAYNAVSRQEVNKLIGPELQADVPLDQIVAEVKERYHVYFLLPGGASYGGDKDVMTFWAKHLGPERIIQLDSPEDTSECIGLTIGLNEGAITWGDGAEGLRGRGVAPATIDRLAQSLANTASTAPTVRATGARRL